jgi:hypothetical protein
MRTGSHFSMRAGVRRGGTADDRLGLQAADGRVRRRSSRLLQDLQHDMDAFRREDPGEVVFVQAWGQRVEALAEPRRGGSGEGDLLLQGGEFFLGVKLCPPACGGVRKILEGGPAEVMLMGGIIPREDRGKMRRFNVHQGARCADPVNFLHHADDII